jgi:hypothetical protein
MAAQAAVSFIKKGCAMLDEGRMEITDAKAKIEQAVGNAKAIYKEVSGLWGWLKGLFGVSEKAVVPSSEVQAPVLKKKRNDPEPEALQLQLIADVGAKLGEFFDIQQKLVNYYHSLEEESLSKYDPNQNTSKKAIERALVELQMENLGNQIREQMTIYAPSELKAIYTRFLKMYGKIKEEQAFAQQQEIQKARNERWQREFLQRRRADRLSSVVMVVLAVLWIWGVILGMAWQMKNQTLFWSD